MKKKSDTQRRNRNKKFSTDKVQKSSFLNSIYLSAEYNRCLMNSLINIYKNYTADSNMKDIVVYNNLRNTSFQTNFKYKKQIKTFFSITSKI